MCDIVVVGSINADLVFTSKVRPKAGETVLGDDFKTIPGGKGANQAVAASRLGSNVTMLGCVGNDENGNFLISNLTNNNVNTKFIERVNNVPSGVANIILAEGDNSIIVIPGANYSITQEIIDKHKNILLSAKVVILQLEIPISVVEYVVNICYENNIKTILNPAPAAKLNQSLIDKVTFLTPNEHECSIIFGDSNVQSLLSKYPNKLLITEGSKGVKYHNKNDIRQVPAKEVKVVDTTGAGDTFNGAFASAVVNSYKIEEAITFANKAAALSVTKFGAQGGMPTLKQVKEFC